MSLPSVSLPQSHRLLANGTLSHIFIPPSQHTFPLPVTPFLLTVDIVRRFPVGSRHWREVEVSFLLKCSQWLNGGWCVSEHVGQTTSLGKQLRAFSSLLHAIDVLSRLVPINFRYVIVTEAYASVIWRVWQRAVLKAIRRVVGQRERERGVVYWQLVPMERLQLKIQQKMNVAVAV